MAFLAIFCVFRRGVQIDKQECLVKDAVFYICLSLAAWAGGIGELI